MERQILISQDAKGKQVASVRGRMLHSALHWPDEALVSSRRGPADVMLEPPTTDPAQEFMLLLRDAGSLKKPVEIGYLRLMAQGTQIGVRVLCHTEQRQMVELLNCQPWERPAGDDTTPAVVTLLYQKGNRDYVNGHYVLLLPAKADERERLGASLRQRYKLRLPGAALMQPAVMMVRGQEAIDVDPDQVLTKAVRLATESITRCKPQALAAELVGAVREALERKQLPRLELDQVGTLSCVYGVLLAMTERVDPGMLTSRPLVS